jgi:endonuclease/exonuclease/phosphatase family metal-dependent hydrolase
MTDEASRWQRGFAGRPLPLGWKQSHNYGEPGGPRFAREFPALARDAPPPGSALRVATYNVELVKRPDAVLSLLQREPRLGEADILALQETDEELVARAAEQLGAHYVYYPSMLHPVTGRNFGPAILSRWPILEDGKVPLPGRGWTRGTRRIAVRTTLLVRGVRLRFYSVHFSTMWEMLPSGQDAQAAAVVADASTSPDPVLVAGDLNRMGAGRVFAKAGYHWLTRKVGRTHHVWSFDHVFLRGMEPRSVEAASVNEALATSDHRAVWTTLDLQG